MGNSNPPEPPPEAKVQKKYTKILSTCNLTYKKDYIVYNVPLKTLNGYIHTLEGGFQNKETLVMFHGYGATSAFYFKMLPWLFERFHVFAVDWYGMGNSFRYDFKLDGFDEAIDVYTKSVEEWRQQLDLQNFFIMAHSLGGYITNYYLQRYKPPTDMIKGVFMLSPAGMACCTKEMMEEKFKETRENWFKKVGMDLAFYLINDLHYSPFDFFWLIKNKEEGLKKYFGSSRFDLSNEECKLLISYYSELLNLKSSGERVLGIFLNYFRGSKYPWNVFIEDLVKQYKYCFFFGDRDWMDHQGAAAMISSIRERIESKLEPMIYVKNCGHHMILENPNQQISDIEKVFEKWLKNDNQNIGINKNIYFDKNENKKINQNQSQNQNFFGSERNENGIRFQNSSVSKILYFDDEGNEDMHEMK